MYPLEGSLASVDWTTILIGIRVRNIGRYARDVKPTLTRVFRRYQHDKPERMAEDDPGEFVVSTCPLG